MSVFLSSLLLLLFLDSYVFFFSIGSIFLFWNLFFFSTIAKLQRWCPVFYADNCWKIVFFLAFRSVSSEVYYFLFVFVGVQSGKDCNVFYSWCVTSILWIQITKNIFFFRSQLKMYRNNHITIFYTTSIFNTNFTTIILRVIVVEMLLLGVCS